MKHPRLLRGNAGRGRSMTRPLVLRFQYLIVAGAMLQVSELTPSGAIESLYTLNLSGPPPYLPDVVESELENGRDQFVVQLPKSIIGDLIFSELVATQVKLTERGVQLILLEPSPKVLEFFKVIYLDQLFAWCSSLDEVIEVLGDSVPASTGNHEGPISSA